MRAVVITEPGGPEVLKIQEVPDPEPGPDDVLVDVKASALNRADTLQRQGGYPAPPGSPDDILGLEFSGVVLETGANVTDLAEGDRVFGLLGGGGYASRVVTHSRMAMRIPDNLDFVQAAAVPEVFFTAYDALFNHCELTMGESVLIHAAGSGVGTARCNWPTTPAPSCSAQRAARTSCNGPPSWGWTWGSITGSRTSPK